jgi:hypothetical protein
VSQINRSIVAQPIPLKKQPQRYGATVAIAAGIAATSIAGVLIFSSITSAPPAVQTPQIEEPVDGWMPAALAGQAARLERMQDGYMPGLLADRASSDAVDGFLPGLLADRANSDAVDGWESGLMH